MRQSMPAGVIFNAYPDSIGGKLAGMVSILQRPEFKNVFSLCYLLPSIFNSDLDRGFSIIDYNLNHDLSSQADLNELSRLGIEFKFDLVLNHLSVRSPQFQDLLKHGDQSEYIDFFIDWNAFWQNQGELSAEGFIIPRRGHLKKLFMRKPGLPILKVRFPDGLDRFYWNTFYQNVSYVEQKPHYLGQMDLNAESEKVWEFYAQTLKKLHALGAKIVRLDAFAYLHKQPGMVNFFNKPGTWDILARLRRMADRYDLMLLPEIHSAYGSGIHLELAEKGYPIFDFFLPGLVIDALDRGTGRHLLHWMKELVNRGIKTVNMLGCHDGIPVLDLKGKLRIGKTTSCLMSKAQIESVIENIIRRGGIVKNLFGPNGKRIAYYQVNATFFSALGEDDQKLRLARAIQMFTPGTPQVWYLDLFAGKNDGQALAGGDECNHKEINRTNLSLNDVEKGLTQAVVRDQLQMLRLRNTSSAFHGRLEIGRTKDSQLDLTWQNGIAIARLRADLISHEFCIHYTDEGNQEQVMPFQR